ncbi:hypothetical protein [Cellulosimicrobium sp. Marseille-Q8652]
MTRTAASPGDDRSAGPRAHGDGERLEELADALAMTGDAADEHWRWAVYRRATEVPALRTTLLRAVEVEPDAAVAVGVAWAVLERDDAETARWVAAVPAPDRRRVESRAAEIAVLRGVRSLDTAPSAQDVNGWSDWLQRRVVTEVDGRRVLAALAEHGRTRRVRGAARERLARARVADGGGVGQGGNPTVRRERTADA